MSDTEKGNQTAIQEFILLGLETFPELQILLFWFFLVIYLITITGNLLIFLLVVANQHLHTPMYFFLANLSWLDACYSSTILPKLLANLLTGDRTITLHGCLAQCHIFGICAGVETYLLAAMSYDRFVAICRPLLYTSVMNIKFCFQLIAGTWVNSLIFTGILVALIDPLPFCGSNVIDHYFCDFLPLEKLSCSDRNLLELLVFFLAIIFTIAPFLLTVISYICIIGTIIKIKSTIGRQKAFSTCSSHLMVVGLYYGALIFVYMLPDSPTLRPLNKIFSIFYTVMTPLVNPLIYSLRNKEVHKILRQLYSKVII
ncbi:olfactory receptor 5G3-like [Protobothrops mucrosquamatus]|uniref:olfactory receptor 5G3-like n=1 Tax=Protobothrops mucrosquamatus TaxID=103944 RepID=UPI0007758339|nr:olfactory receptor 5G3-like [Protobothrops mucrosquamatus]